MAAGVSVFFGVGALLAGPGGRLAERVGALPAMRTAAVVSGCCLLLIALTVHWVWLLWLFLGVAGAVNAVNQPAINLFMAEQIPIERQGLAFGIKQSAIPAAILVSGLALPLIALPLGWRAAFAIFGAAAILVALLAGRGRHRLAPAQPRPVPGRPSRTLVLIAIGAALASSGPSALGAYLVASAVDAGIDEGTAGVLAAVGSACSLGVRVGLGHRADLRARYGLLEVVVLLAAGALGFLLLSTEVALPFVAGAVIAYGLGWGWPGLFNTAVVHAHRRSPGWATGISQSGIYVGAAGGPLLYGLVSERLGYGTAWAVTAGIALCASFAFWLASRSLARV